MNAVSRRALLALLAGAAAGLSACGKRGSPLPPPGETSDFPRQYPAPSSYPHPDIGSGKTQQNSPPEQQGPTPQSGDNDNTQTTPGLYP